MRKYLRAAVCLSFSMIKFCFLKTLHFSCFRFTVFSLVSPFTEIIIEKKSLLSFGKMIRVRSGSKINVCKGAELRIGDNSSLNHGCIIISQNRIIVGNNVQIGPYVLIYDHDHDFRVENGLKNLTYRTAPIEIEDNVWIGAGCIILKGVHIGTNSVIGAGTTVSKNVPANTIVCNNKELYFRKIEKATHQEVEI